MASNFFFFNTSDSKDDENSCFPSLTFQERMIGFAVCFILGTIIELLSFGAFFGILIGNPTKFALSFTLGNVLSLCGTGFLIGPMRQLKNMSNKNRLFTSLIYIGSMLMTLISAIVFKSKFLTLIFLIIQICSFVWYVASYIPFARDCIKSILKKCCKFELE